MRCRREGESWAHQEVGDIRSQTLQDTGNEVMGYRCGKQEGEPEVNVNKDRGRNRTLLGCREESEEVKFC